MLQPFKLYIGNWVTDEWEFINEFPDEDELFYYIDKKAANFGYKKYQQSGWFTEDGSVIVDFGSRTKFFKYN